MPKYELELEGLLSDDSLRGLGGMAATTQGNTTLLRRELSSQDDLVRLLEAFEALGLGLQRLRRSDHPKNDSSLLQPNRGVQRSAALRRRRTTSYPSGEAQLTDARHRREVPTRGLGS